MWTKAATSSTESENPKFWEQETEKKNDIQEEEEDHCLQGSQVGCDASISASLDTVLYLSQMFLQGKISKRKVTINTAKDMDTNMVLVNKGNMKIYVFVKLELYDMLTSY